jgi:hypothetical protein
VTPCKYQCIPDAIRVWLIESARKPPTIVLNNLELVNIKARGFQSLWMPVSSSKY